MEKWQETYLATCADESGRTATRAARAAVALGNLDVRTMFRAFLERHGTRPDLADVVKAINVYLARHPAGEA